MKLIFSAAFLCAIFSVQSADSYVFTLDGKPFKPGVYSLRGDAENPKSGDLIWVNRVVLTLGDETRCDFVAVDNGVCLEKDGKRSDVTKPPEGGLDGLLSVGDVIYVSSWNGSAVYRGKLGGTFEVVISGVKGPADIGYDKKRNRVLVPRFMEDAIEAYEMK